MNEPRRSVADLSDLSVERTVLGAALWEPEAAAFVAGLSEYLFMQEWHRNVLKAIASLVKQGVGVDHTTVRLELARVKAWDPATSPEKLAALLDEGNVPTQMPHYTEQLRELALRRSVVRQARETLEAAYDQSEPIRRTLDRHMDACVRLEMEGQGARILTPREWAREVAQGKEPARLPTGFARLDAVLTGGLTCGNLHLLAGRPGNGKTAWVVQFLTFVTGILGIPGLLISLDMSRSEIGRRYIRNSTVEDLERSGFHIADPISPTASEVVSLARRGVVKHGIQVVVVDHMGKVLPDRQAERRDLEVGESAVTFRNAARSLDLPFLVLSQMSRAVEKRDVHRPILSDLAESAKLEAEAATVLFIWPKKGKKEDLQDMVISVEKDRDGPTGDVDYTFNRPQGRFPE